MSSGAPRVALVHDWLTGMRGGEKVLEAIAGLLPEAPIYTLFHFPGTVSRSLESRQIVTSFLQHAPAIERVYRHYLPLYPAAAASLRVDSFDLVVSSSHCVAKGVRRGPRARHLCYCHTPMRYVWDQRRAYFPESRSPLGRLREAILDALQRWDVRTADRVDRYLANSRFVADRIARYYGRSADVLHPPVDVEAFRPVDAPERSYALVVAALAPYKKVEVAIHACERLGLELRVVGEGPERPRLERLAGSKTRFLGRVDGPELARLYAHAVCCIQPGIEDFGISSVESLASGTPVVAAGLGGVLDIVESGVDGVLYQPPALDGQEAAAALAVAIDKAREIEFNSMNLRRRAERFSSAHFTAGLSKVLSALDASRGGTSAR